MGISTEPRSPERIFKMTPSGSVTVLRPFTSGESGDTFSSLTQAVDGNFYGITQFGGAFLYGRAFSITPAGVYTVLHHFAGGTNDGAWPVSGLIQGTDGNFYGTTKGGGASAFGTVFRMTPSGTVTLVHSFSGVNAAGDGSQPDDRACPSE